MYPPALIFGTILLLILLGAAAFLALQRPTRTHRVRAKDLEPVPKFASEFMGELNRLDEELEPPPEAAMQRGLEESGDAYTLHQLGEPTFRIASKLGIGKADAELLIKIEDSRTGKDPSLPHED